MQPSLAGPFCVKREPQRCTIQVFSSMAGVSFGVCFYCFWQHEHKQKMKWTPRKKKQLEKCNFIGWIFSKSFFFLSEALWLFVFFWFKKKTKNNFVKKKQFWWTVCFCFLEKTWKIVAGGFFQKCLFSFLFFFETKKKKERTTKISIWN
jgi:magnesium-transporting ATPase (P-type)